MEAIKFEHVSFAYDNGFVAVDDISLTIEAGEKLRSSVKTVPERRRPLR
jgi:ABC-type multidrug transport system fused ATPase/permease subunit